MRKECISIPWFRCCALVVHEASCVLRVQPAECNPLGKGNPGNLYVGPSPVEGDYARQSVLPRLASALRSVAPARSLIMSPETKGTQDARTHRVTIHTTVDHFTLDDGKQSSAASRCFLHLALFSLIHAHFSVTMARDSPIPLPCPTLSSIVLSTHNAQSFATQRAERMQQACASNFICSGWGGKQSMAEGHERGYQAGEPSRVRYVRM